MSARHGYRLTPQAEADLEDIWLCTFKTWSLEQADEYHAGIIAACEGLAARHKKGRPVDVRDGYLKYAVGSHLVFYRITETWIDVMRVLHQKIDAGRHL